MSFLLLLIVIGAGIAIWAQSNKKKEIGRERASFADAQADARRWIERLGSQVLTLSGNDTASTQALADASERYNAASAAIGQAETVKQAQLARESALEGLHYVNAAREIMGLPAGPELPPLAGQRAAAPSSTTASRSRPRPRRARTPQTTTPAARSRAARFRLAGTRPRGGPRPWPPACGPPAR